MPRYNVFIPDHQIEQWEALENKSQWVQQKLDEEFEEQKKLEVSPEKLEALNAQGN